MLEKFPLFHNLNMNLSNYNSQSWEHISLTASLKRALLREILSVYSQKWSSLLFPTPHLNQRGRFLYFVTFRQAFQTFNYFSGFL